MYDENYLAHYGILGMKWGVRRFQPYSVRGRKSGEGGKEVGEAKKHSETPSHEHLLKSTNAEEVYKYRDQLSDKELRERVNRIQTEQQLKQMINQSSKKGERAAQKIYKNVRNMAITAISLAIFNEIKKEAPYVFNVKDVSIKDFVDTAKWMYTKWRP